VHRHTLQCTVRDAAVCRAECTYARHSHVLVPVDLLTDSVSLILVSSSCNYLAEMSWMWLSRSPAEKWYPVYMMQPVVSCKQTSSQLYNRLSVYTVQLVGQCGSIVLTGYDPFVVRWLHAMMSACVAWRLSACHCVVGRWWSLSAEMCRQSLRPLCCDSLVHSKPLLTVTFSTVVFHRKTLQYICDHNSCDLDNFCTAVSRKNILHIHENMFTSRE